MGFTLSTTFVDSEYNIYFARNCSEFRLKGYQKVLGGVKYHINLFLNLVVDDNLAFAKHQIERYGNFSPRPFLLGQGCDGSTDACVHALFADYCRSVGLNPVALYREAYAEWHEERYSDPDYQELTSLTSWQGVSYPDFWGEKEWQGLCQSLYSINNRSLVSVLEEIVGIEALV